MGWIENLLLALALASDAFAVSVVRGITGRGARADAAITACCFAAAQTVMPIIGYSLGESLASPFLDRGGSLLAAVILLFLGVKTILDQTREEPPVLCASGRGGYLRVLAAQSAATAIDALAVGIGLCAVDTPLLPTVATIGWVTGLLCYLGYHLGRNLCSGALGAYAQAGGGLVLIGLAAKLALAW